MVVDEKYLNQGSIGNRVLASAFATFFLMIYIPFEIFVSNLGEFSVRTVDLFSFLVPAWIFALLVLIGVASTCRAMLRQRLIALMLVVGMAIWIQGSFLVWDYGTLNGTDIQWSEYWQNALYDTPVWLILILFSLIFPQITLKIGRPIAAILLVVQFVVLIPRIFTADEAVTEASKRNYSIDYTNKYSFSRDGNVILIVLDAFQGDIFYEIVSKESKYEEIFKGFTYFKNAIAGGNYTELAIPALLTGKTYDNSLPRKTFLKEAYLESSITTHLKNAGFGVDIFPWVGWGNESIYFDESIASNIKRVEKNDTNKPTFTEKNAKEVVHLLDLSIFRSVPHLLKKYIHNGHKWFLEYIASYLVPDQIKQVVNTSTNQFELGAFVSQGRDWWNVGIREPVFKYYHFKGAHAPLNVNEELEFTNKIFLYTKKSYVHQAKANLLALGDVFDELRRLEVYNDSMIVIVGDHGSGNSPDLYIEPEGSSREPMRLEGSLRNFRRDKARAIPLVLVKLPGHSRRLEISNAPVATTDVPATVLHELSLRTNNEAPSMFNIDPSEPRIRFHGAFDFSPNKSNYVGDITLYRIEGDSWKNESWRVEGILKSKAQ